MKDNSHRATLLYVEDDESLRYVTQDNLTLANYEVIACPDGQAALQAFHSHKIDLCIIDVMLPKVDGFALAKKVRLLDEHVPILFLSAKSLKEDRIAGLKLGADDYMTKPFSIEELILKVGVFLRRSSTHQSTTAQPSEQIFSLGDYRFDQEQQQLVCGSTTRGLTQRESALLAYLLHRSGQLVKREEILETIWRDDNYFAGRSLDVFISRLRKYLQEDSSVQIENVHGVGFRLSVVSEKPPGSK